MAVPSADAAVGAVASMADAQTSTAGLLERADASTDHYLVLGIGLAEAATQTELDVTSLEETLASALSALDSSQSAQLALEQRVAELRGQSACSTDASTQTELDMDGLCGLEERLLQSALSAVHDAHIIKTDTGVSCGRPKRSSIIGPVTQYFGMIVIQHRSSNARGPCDQYPLHNGHSVQVEVRCTFADGEDDD